MKLKLNIGKRIIIFSFLNLKAPTEWTEGVMNKIPNSNLFCAFADYDSTPLEYLQQEATHLQEVFNLGDIHIFESSEKNYHFICFSTMVFKQYMLLLNSSSCDFAYKIIPNIHIRNFVIRNFSKGNTGAPKYVMTLKGKTNRLQSTAHYEYFKTLYPELEKFPLENPDGNTKLRLISYQTSNNT